MGTFRVTSQIGDPHGLRYETVEALADMGATHPSLPGDALAELGTCAERLGPAPGLLK